MNDAAFFDLLNAQKRRRQEAASFADGFRDRFDLLRMGGVDDPCGALVRLYLNATSSTGVLTEREALEKES